MGKTIMGENEFKNVEQQELFNSEKARVQDGGHFPKFEIETLSPDPVCKDDSSYLPPSCVDRPDLHTNISSSITKTKTLFVAKNCHVSHLKPVREPAG